MRFVCGYSVEGAFPLSEMLLFARSRSHPAGVHRSLGGNHGSVVSEIDIIISFNGCEIDMADLSRAWNA